MAGDRSTAPFETAALIGAGGFVGANLRYGVELLAPGPAGTLAANTLGSFALAVLLFAVSGSVGRRTRLLAGTGVLSSFTTYSTFALETAQASGWLFVGNVVGTYALGFAGAVLGLALARRLDGVQA